ncbi:DNRLRE domain-containing protein, partial [Candidatus Woesearchaeota archaeon]|nr:DNRLRE domain-containing protein [Candidatus Woesearchaeota archaeon]
TYTVQFVSSVSDTDYFYFDENLPNCAGNECAFSSNGYETSCEFVPAQQHYSCLLENSEHNYYTYFTYKAFDDLGNNLIRYLKPIYLPSAPIVEFGELTSVSFPEGLSYTLNLDDYVFDADTDAQDITWTVSSDNFVNVEIDPSTHIATISQKDLNWIGSDIILFTATDPEGSSDSDMLTVHVTSSDNDAPVVVKNPDTDNVQLIVDEQQLFSVEVSDPDYDPLSITWRLDSNVVAQNFLGYTFTAGQVESTHVLEVTVSDGEHDVIVSWAIDVSLPEANIPNVTNVQANPSVQEQLETVDISATVTDDSAVGEVRVMIVYPDATNQEFVMSNSGDLYSYQFTDTLQIGNYVARIIAEDIFHNINQRETVGFVITPESEAPTVLNVDANPNPANQGSSVAITADVTDNVGVDTVQVRITSPDSGEAVFSMNNVGGDTYRFDFADTADAGVYFATIIATDVNNNVNSGISVQFMVNDIGMPTVLNVNANPDPQNQGGLVTISADVTDDVGLSSVQVRITYPDFSSNTFDMSNTVGDTYSYGFTDTAASGTYTATIIATDTSTNVNSGESVQFTISDSTNPTVLNVNVDPNPQNQSLPVTITADVTDDSGLNSVQVRITYPDSSSNTFGMVNVGGNTNSFQFFDTAQTGNYIATIIATDTSSNVNNTESANFRIEIPGLVLVTTDLATSKSLITGDTHTDSDWPDASRGGLTYFRIKNSAETARAYIAFDLTSLPIIDFESVQLSLYRSDNWGDTRVYEFYYCDDFFNEATLTWNNQDSEVVNCDAAPFMTVSQADITRNTYNAFDLTSLLQTKNDKDTFTIKIKDQVESGTSDMMQFYSKENGANEPFLNVSYYTNQ